MRRAVEYGSGEAGVGAAGGEDGEKIVEGIRAARGDDRHGDGGGDFGGEFAIEAAACAVAIDGGEENFARAARDGFGGPRGGVEARGVAATARVRFPRRALALDVNRKDDGLRTELAREFGNQFGALDRGGVDGDFIGAGEEHGLAILHAANTATGGERDIELFGDAANGIEESGAAF